LGNVSAERQTQITASMAVKQQKSESQMDCDGLLAMPCQIHLSAADFHQLSLLGLMDELVLGPIIYLGPHCLCLSRPDTFMQGHVCCLNFFGLSNNNILVHWSDTQLTMHSHLATASAQLS